MVHAENGDVVAEMTAKLLGEGNVGPEGHAYSRPSSRRRGDEPRDHDCGHGGVPLYVVHTSCEEAHEAIRRARQQGKRVWGEPLIQHLTLDEGEYFNADWDTRGASCHRHSEQETSGQPLVRFDERLAVRRRQTTAPLQPNRNGRALVISKIPNGTAA